jgi:SAM-dependent MidA family methyltransferase
VTVDGSNADLVDLIREEILAAPDRRITFARFMERALAEPGLGYYQVSDRRPTREGDFLTAPELHTFFGRLIGRQLEDVWQRLGSPATFTVREFGAGRGTLERDVLDGLANDGSPLARGLAWEAVDVATTWPEGPVAGAIIANEFVDALPVHRVVRRGDQLLERYVTLGGEKFAEEEGEPSTPQIARQLAREGVSFVDGQIGEVSLAGPAWMAGAAASLERGMLLVIDYGHDAGELYSRERLGGTLATFRDHRAGDDPLQLVGLQDITAHVDFTALDGAAVASGLQGLGSTSQGRFLVSLGLGDLLSNLGRQPSVDTQAYLLARAAVARFLDPRHLGGFRVAAWGRGLPSRPPLRGFSDRHGWPS